MSFADAVRSVLSQYATFQGRARRSEYWWFSLFLLLVGIAARVVDSALGVDFEASGGPVSLVVNLALLLPSLAVSVRRLHDLDRSGWWLLLALIPIVGWIVLLVFAVQNGTPGPNRFGPSPKS
ncbi:MULTISPECIES: DUF805 domain-containing protein [unclassified Micromonospora]|uniref:DUF805 domain-containing protein n=1 Tax=unclassified Micromonospora TaxID=2617518 RepID=UPI0022B72FDE|nr:MULTISPECIES: DUF805 domain-containing protein [unclassified Micromonospora]MCZ7417958.1 DUF805 domain-containing protein [Verrucosispora sp. WMMA2121]MCZ7417995.1 DUF805 domain-containing protein [Verrucosispora sp. WMMA2121]MCZ7419598.1 DUF805 domain-containing protein [Verrucosispora sp. WMMA2121]WBB89802.1 DUF805 domain-containing protein [Verrucosispora sp. WMMC514]